MSASKIWEMNSTVRTTAQKKRLREYGNKVYFKVDAMNYPAHKTGILCPKLVIFLIGYSYSSLLLPALLYSSDRSLQQEGADEDSNSSFYVSKY